MTIQSLVAKRCHPPIARNVLRWTSSRWTDSPLHFKHDLVHSKFGRRLYATVHTEDTERLWSQFGKDAPAAFTADTNASKAEADPSSDSSGVEGAPQHSSDATIIRKFEEKLAALKKTARKAEPPRRRRIRKCIHEALQISDPASALMHLSSRQQQPSHQNVSKAAVSGPTGDSASSNEVPILSADYIKLTQPLPTNEQYPMAPAELFEPSTVSMTIHNTCQKLGLSMEAKFDYERKKALRRLSPSSTHIQSCTLTLEIPDVCKATAVGEDTNNQGAKKAAWLHALSKMHQEGTLKELFLDPNVDTQDLPKGAGKEPELQPVEVDEQTKLEEKDAKIEIYNYAASLGIVPEFTVNRVQPRTPRARLGRTPKKPKAFYQVTISLSGRGIEVTAAGKDLRTAEIATAIAFKQQAEMQHSKAGQTTPDLSAVLSVETAKAFFEFYKQRENGLNIEIEQELVDVHGTRQNLARVTMDGVPKGQSVTMKTKKEAESVAYLTTAIEITTSNPDLLTEFEQRLEQGKGKVLQPVKSIDLPISFETIRLMRNSLVEARNAGLSDLRESLSAEVSNTEARNPRSQRRLSAQDLEGCQSASTRPAGAFW